MTLWDYCVLFIKGRWARRRWFGPRMTVWPYWSKPQRFNVIQRWAIRRVVFLVVVVAVFRANPFHPVTLGVTILGLTLVMTEHRVHRKQYEALWGKKKKGR